MQPPSTDATNIPWPPEISPVDRDHVPPSRTGIAARVALVAAAVALLGAAPSPDPRRGEALYVGTTRLSAGGAPCLGCHGVAGHGLARAASFGPDLSGAHAQYGADGLDGLLEDVVFPSMAPLYRGHPVTREERADLIAFLAEATGAPPPAPAGSLAAGIAAAALAFLAFVIVLGRRGAPRARATVMPHRETP